MSFEAIFSTEPTVHARSPGRVEFLGNHTDYNGGCVMGFAIDYHVEVFASPREDDLICLYSDLDNQTYEYSLNELPLDQTVEGWTAYPIGVLAKLIKRGLSAHQGANLYVTSTLPHGSGLSSSAAFEVASGVVFCYLYQYELTAQELALVCLEAENDFVGLPCGMLDQTTCACSEKDAVTFINCQTKEVEIIPCRGDVAFWIINSGKKHSLVDSLYSTRHAECMSALAKLQQNFEHRPNLVSYSLEELDMFANTLSNEEYKRVMHVISEHNRVKQAIGLLKDGNMEQVGNLLCASHQSSKDFFENSCDELDFLVSRLIDHPKVFGARLSGGGFGGAVLAMTEPDCTAEDLEEIAVSYQEKFSVRPNLLRTSLANGPSISTKVAMP